MHLKEFTLTQRTRGMYLPKKRPASSMEGEGFYKMYVSQPKEDTALPNKLRTLDERLARRKREAIQRALHNSAPEWILSKQVT
jgi:hypothetical protein